MKHFYENLDPYHVCAIDFLNIGNFHKNLVKLEGFLFLKKRELYLFFLNKESTNGGISLIMGRVGELKLL